MKILFAVNDDNISESIMKKYQSMYKKIISGKNVYYFNAILKELQKDKTYDRIVISEDLEPLTNKNYETIDNFIFEKLDRISDEAVTNSGEDIPIIMIATDRHSKGDAILNKLFGIGIYSTLIGQDRSITNLCELINKPRSKKEAKIYYQITSNDIDYKEENQEDVSEVEIQNILTHYKRLGKNEEKYVDSFNSIASQYTDEQLKVIVKFLPLRVKAVLEEKCPKYQQIAVFAGESLYLKNQTPYSSSQVNPITSKPRSTSQAMNDDGIKIEAINTTQTKKPTKPVVIPTTVSTKNVRKVQKVNKKVEEDENLDIQVDEIKEDVSLNEEDVPQVKKGRGRPKKIVNQETQVTVEQPKRKRGRPKKFETIEEKIEPEVLPGFEEQEPEILPGLEEQDTEFLPGFEEKEIIPSVEDETVDILPGIEQEKSNIDDVLTFDEATLPGIEQEDTSMNDDYEVNYQNKDSIIEENIEEKQITNKVNFVDNNLERLLTSDKKIVSFVGTSKNGTSFLINNLAEVFSKQGIKTAILDLTKNRNSYYIYTKNEEELRKIAIDCTSKLLQGIAKGISVNKNLDVYTSLPGENEGIDEYEKILSTLAQNYSLILLDCDFGTNYGYIKESQEIYLVQSMDVLTIQPLTAYLRDLKAKNVLDQNKLKIVINKYTKVRSVTERTIIGGMAFYNDPSMSFMTELFNRENIKYAIIPFEMQTYSKYLEGLINCNITTNGYPKDTMNSLKKLANMVYPLISNSQNKYNNPKYNKYASTNNNVFSNDMNNTLDKMKKSF